MQLTSITQAVTAFSPVAIAMLTGVFAARSNRRARSDKIMTRLTAEIAALDTLPDEASAKAMLTSQVEATVAKYKQTCLREDTFRRDGVGVGLGIVLGGGGIALGTWAAVQGGSTLWWWVLAVPAIILGVPGFFHEWTGGDSRTATAQPTDATTTTTSD